MRYSVLIIFSLMSLHALAKSEKADRLECVGYKENGMGSLNSIDERLDVAVSSTGITIDSPEKFTGYSGSFLQSKKACLMGGSSTRCFTLGARKGVYVSELLVDGYVDPRNGSRPWYILFNNEEILWYCLPKQ